MRGRLVALKYFCSLKKETRIFDFKQALSQFSQASSESWIENLKLTLQDEKFLIGCVYCSSPAPDGNLCEIALANLILNARPIRADNHVINRDFNMSDVDWV